MSYWIELQTNLKRISSRGNLQNEIKHSNIPKQNRGIPQMDNVQQKWLDEVIVCLHKLSNKWTSHLETKQTETMIKTRNPLLSSSGSQYIYIDTFQHLQ
jgi:gluconate kinase|uniref:Uncharacterized protein n=1 Tax=Populus trichocarpa TaxID=3694 RepID=A0A2K1YWU4_POPTR